MHFWQLLNYTLCYLSFIHEVIFSSPSVISFIFRFYLQYEGAVKEDGRGPSVWDKFAHSFGNVAIHYYPLELWKQKRVVCRNKQTLRRFSLMCCPYFETQYAITFLTLVIILQVR